MTDDTHEHDTLLTSLVRARGSLQPEPVATFGLFHLLRTSKAVRDVLSALGHEIDPAGEYGALAWTEQASGSDGIGRPDLMGYTDSGPRFLIEAKFDAGLTAAQSGTGYLDNLSKTNSGILAFLVPEDRRHLLWRQILLDICDESPPESNPSKNQPPVLSHKLEDGRIIAVVTWPYLLQRLRDGIASAGELGASADLHQLSALVEHRTRTGWVPLAGNDLSALTGRQLAHLSNEIRSAAQHASLKTVSNGSNDWGPARWVRDAQGARIFWVGIRIPTWGRLGRSPIWAVVVERDVAKLAKYRDALRLHSNGSYEVLDLDSKTVGVPILVPVGAESDEVRAELTVQLKAVRDALIAVGAKSQDDTGGEEST